ncbi:MAG: sulfite exporter TauE/SafE family protein [Gemmatimonadota bacterium]|nr:sulfite exporter TauE/SafE family protein [Gemmatimonadota bacterium]MDQ8168192.1 sulfite exporter TauE/SafE family protein [Gemmatimonadota bacterium]MDQ8173328.1 sulfite exporter TauE/SafE family protein [Gemmatimonadota bacterium]
MILLLLAIGVGAGVLSGIFGIGGGIVVVPALIYLVKMTPQQAAGTSLAALVLPLGAAIGAATYYRAGHLQLMDALLIAVGMAAGAYFGAQIATNVDATVLRRAFALLMVGMAVKMWVG